MKPVAFIFSFGKCINNTNTSPTHHEHHQHHQHHHPTQNHPNITLSFKVPQETIKTAAKTIAWTMFILVM